MSIESYQRAVERHREELARLQREKSNEASMAVEATKRSRAAADVARRTNSTSTMQSKMREAQRYQDTALRHEKSVAEIEKKIAQEQRRLDEAERRLSKARDEAERRRAREQEQAAREHQRRMESITDKLTQHEALHRVALSAIKKLEHLPNQITVLFLASNPLDQEQLRLDEEVRAIGDMIRKSKYRDAVRLESRWALRPLDVLQAINECQPTVVHFSGHGSKQDEIIFQDDAGNAKPVSKEALVQTMAAASGNIQLVFFNTCYSRTQAEAVVNYVPAAIGMKVSIGDEAARVFAAQFYSAVGFGLSIGTAFEQAKAALMLEGISEESTPELFVTEGLTPDDIVLVAPGGDESDR